MAKLLKKLHQRAKRTEWNVHDYLSLIYVSVVLTFQIILRPNGLNSLKIKINIISNNGY